MKVQRLIATTAGLALVASAPIMATAASAHDNGKGHGRDDGREHHSSSRDLSHRQDRPRVTVKLAVTPAQATAILAARKAYFTTVASANSALNGVLLQVQTDIVNATSAQRLALTIAKDAYDFTVATGLDATAAKATLDQAQAAYNAAVASAKSAAQAKVDSARSAYKTALENAKNSYRAAVTAAFPAGTAIPNELLTISSKSVELVHGSQGWTALVKIHR